MGQVRTEPFRSFYFDCDSTLSRIEGVDELTASLEPQLRAEIKSLTQRAMEGEIPLSEVYEKRLAMLAPDRERLEAIGRAYVDNVLPDAKEVVAALLYLGKTVGIVSGGLRQPVLVLARYLGIQEADVHAVEVLLDGQGRYLDFDRQSPLWQNAGKTMVLRSLPRTQHPMLLVGDGVTDLEAKEAVELFIGFGGVQRRHLVAREAELYIETPRLLPVLQAGLCPEEKKSLRSSPSHARLGSMLEP